MKKRLVPVLTLVFIAGMAIAADKKSPPSVRVIRAEGKTEEFLLNPTEVTIGKSVTWVPSYSPASYDPALEFTSSDGRSLSLDLEFDSFDTRENVSAKFISSLEGLTLVDPNLQRPPLVKWCGHRMSPACRRSVESSSRCRRNTRCSCRTAHRFARQ